MDIEKRLGVMEAVEAIKVLKARYMRGIDLKDWDIVRDSYTKDAVFELVGAIPPTQGNDAITKALAAGLGKDLFVHQIHAPEIEITGPETARAIWYLEYHGFHLEAGRASRAWGYYKDEYEIEGGQWRISRSSLSFRRQERTELEG